MTDLLDRVTDVPDEPADAPSAPRSVAEVPPAAAVRIALASLSAAAGLIHAAMVPAHADLSMVEGIGFAVAAWVQLGLAVVIWARPSRRALTLAVLANVALLAAWVTSRTAGLPFGDQAWHAEDVTIVDGTAVALECALVLGAIGSLRRRRRARLVERRGNVALAAVSVAALVAATAVVLSPDARDHAAGAHGDHASAAPADDLGLSALQNGHQHERGEVPLDPATRRELAAQLSVTRELVDRYPTIAAAEAAGYRRAGPFSPGLGTHYISLNFNLNGDGRMDPDDIRRPTLIYDGLGPDAPIAGFMYLVGSQTEPEGFAGPNDHWHFHTNTCIVMKDGNIEAPLGADRDVSRALCDRYGGTLIENTGYMVHVWTVPGYESSRGVFSEINPAISCPDGTYHARPIEKLGFAKTLCRGG